MEKVMRMAGELAGHGMWDVSSGGVLTPLVGILKNDDSRCMQRLMMGSAEALSYGEKQITHLDPDTQGAALVKDAIVTLETGKTDALVIDVTFGDDEEKRVQILLPYRNAKHADGFAVHRLQLNQMDGFPASAAQQLIEAFFDGIDGHEQAKKIWDKHYIKEPGTSAGYHEDGWVDFSEEDYDTLKRSPFLIFFLVAAADGNIDKKEIKAFQRLLLDSSKFNNRLLTRIVTNVINDIPNIASAMSQQAIDYIAELRKLGDIADKKLPPEEANSFKLSLLMIGKEIAEASGGFFGFGRRIGKEEKSALAAIALCLGINLA